MNFFNNWKFIPYDEHTISEKTLAKTEIYCSFTYFILYFIFTYDAFFVDVWIKQKENLLK
jgi:hypothetical protein